MIGLFRLCIFKHWNFAGSELLIVLNRHNSSQELKRNATGSNNLALHLPYRPFPRKYNLLNAVSSLHPHVEHRDLLITAVYIVL